MRLRQDSTLHDVINHGSMQCDQVMAYPGREHSIYSL